jgi:hypothetical protein
MPIAVSLSPNSVILGRLLTMHLPAVRRDICAELRAGHTLMATRRWTNADMSQR